MKLLTYIVTILIIGSIGYAGYLMVNNPCRDITRVMNDKIDGITWELDLEPADEDLMELMEPPTSNDKIRYEVNEVEWELDLELADTERGSFKQPTSKNKSIRMIDGITWEFDHATEVMNYVVTTTTHQ